MIKSFMHYNPWFTGDILILTEDSLPPTGFQNHTVRFQAPSAELIEKLNRYVRPFHATTQLDPAFCARFISSSSYEEILYIDSDILFTAAIEPELLFAHDISMVPDPWHFRGFRRRRSNLQKYHQKWPGSIATLLFQLRVDLCPLSPFFRLKHTGACFKRSIPVSWANWKIALPTSQF